MEERSAFLVERLDPSSGSTSLHAVMKCPHYPTGTESLCPDCGVELDIAVDKQTGEKMAVLVQYPRRATEQGEDRLRSRVLMAEGRPEDSTVEGEHREVN